MPRIAYRLGTRPGTLYLNIICKFNCLNECVFCCRPRKESEFGRPNSIESNTGSLRLDRIPSNQEVIDSIRKEILPEDKEICFTGLGEPLLYFEKVIRLIPEIKANFPGLKVSLNTSGLAGLYIEEPVRQLEQAGLDKIKISLNAIDELEYEILCRPKLAGAFPSLLFFIRQCNSSGIETNVSFIVGFSRTRTPAEYIEFAVSLGLDEKQIILRNFFPDI